MRFAVWLLASAAGLSSAVPVTAEWTAQTPEVSAVAKQQDIAAVLEAVNRMDRALVTDDRAAFAAMLADDLAVNNPQNGVSVQGATGRRSAGGLISYSRYDRTIEYAGKRDGMVVLMGEERVVPKGEVPMAGQEVRRRFTDLWKTVDGRWLLTARQATIISAR